MIPSQGLDTTVIGSLCLFGEKTAWDTFLVIPVVGHTGAAFSMPGAVIGAGTIPLIVTVLGHIRSSFLSQISGLCIQPKHKILRGTGKGDLRLGPIGNQKLGKAIR